jgi:DNA-binding CsgD family transcriptional regulator
VPTPSEPEIVGRDVEIAEIEQFIDAIDAPAACIIEADAGTGKSTLWRATLARSRARELRVLSAAPAESEHSLAFAGLTDLLGTAFGDVAERLQPPRRQALEAALLIAESSIAPDSRAIALAALDMVRLLAKSGPILVAIDDLQWLDRATFGVLAFVARRLQAEPVGWFLVERSTGPLTSEDELRRAIPEHRTRRVHLGPLSYGALRKLVSSQLGWAPSGRTLRRIQELSGGNPMFALELGRGVQLGVISLQPGEPLPMSLEALIGARVDAMPEATRAAIAAVAATAEPTIEVIRAVCGDSIVDIIGPAAEARIAWLDGDRARLAHPLLGSAAYAGLDLPMRRQLHARLATAVADPEERARHLALAATRPDEQIARELESAAVRAHSRGAPATAAELLRQSASLTPHLRTVDRNRRLLGSAENEFEAGQPLEATTIVRRMVDEEAAPDRRAHLVARLAWMTSYQRGSPAAADLYREALSLASDPGIRASAERGLARGAQISGDLANAEWHSRAAVAAAERSDDLVQRALSRADLAFVQALRGQPTHRRLLDQALADESRVLAMPVLHGPTWIASLLNVYDGNIEAGLKALAHLYEARTQRGAENAVSDILGVLGRAECYAGDLDAAEAHLDESYELAQDTGQVPQQAFVAVVRAILDGRRGREDSAQSSIREASKLARQLGITPVAIEAEAAFGALDLSLARPTSAYRHLGAARERALAAGFNNPAVFRIEADFVEAAIATGELPAADDVTAYLESRAEAMAQPWTMSAAARCRGLVLAATGESATSLGVLQEAAQIATSLAEPFETGRTLLAFGATLRRAKRRKAAREALEEAASVFRALGAAQWFARTGEQLARIGGRAPSRDSLTPSEDRVVRLVGEGLTNREVAARLFITEHTVEAALVRAFAKLGVHSRRELIRGRRTGPSVHLQN